MPLGTPIQQRPAGSAFRHPENGTLMLKKICFQIPSSGEKVEIEVQLRQQSTAKLPGAVSSRAGLLRATSAHVENEEVTSWKFLHLFVLCGIFIST